MRRAVMIVEGHADDSGEGEEDLVEGRAAQADVVELDPAVGEQPHGVGESAVPSETGTETRRPGSSSRGGSVPSGASIVGDRGEVAAVRDPDLDHVEPGTRS